MASVATASGAVPRVRRDTWGTVSYLFMRFSGLLLIILVLGHFIIQHVINDVHNLDINFVAARWSTLGWRVYDAFLLALGLIHGLNGTRIVVDDYVHPRLWNRIVKILILLVGIGLILIGSIAIIGGARVTP
jgi:succinate dehydrogenase / fumarate reductase, membrane anchor subunit